MSNPENTENTEPCLGTVVAQEMIVHKAEAQAACVECADLRKELQGLRSMLKTGQERVALGLADGESWTETDKEIESLHVYFDDRERIHNETKESLLRSVASWRTNCDEMHRILDAIWRAVGGPQDVSPEPQEVIARVQTVVDSFKKQRPET